MSWSSRWPKLFVSGHLSPIPGTFPGLDLYNLCQRATRMTKKTRYFLGGSAAILVAGLGTGLVAYYGGGFPSLSASRSGPSELSYVPADSSVVAFTNVREVMDSQLRQRLKIALPQEKGQQEFQEQTGIDIEHDIDYVVAALTTSGAGGLQKDPN